MNRAPPWRIGSKSLECIEASKKKMSLRELTKWEAEDRRLVHEKKLENRKNTQLMEIMNEILKLKPKSKMSSTLVSRAIELNKDCLKNSLVNYDDVMAELDEIKYLIEAEQKFSKQELHHLEEFVGLNNRATKKDCSKIKILIPTHRDDRGRPYAFRCWVIYHDGNREERGYKWSTIDRIVNN